MKNALPEFGAYIEHSDHAQLAKDPLVSVLMITYNHERYLAKAIECVVQQRTDFRIELLIGEDCSTDRTRKVALKYQSRFPALIRVITSEQNVGMHQNVTRIAAAARGKYIAFCEGDDFWQDPLKLQTQISFLEANPSYGMTHSNYDVFYVAKQKLRTSEISAVSSLQDDQAYLEVLLGKRQILTLTVCVRRDLLEIVRRDNPECTDENWPMGDTQCWLELSRIGLVKYFPNSMATHNILPESASRSTDAARQFAFTEKSGELLLHYLRKYPLPDDIQDRTVKKQVALAMLSAAHFARNSERSGYWFSELRKRTETCPMEALLLFLGSRGRTLCCMVSPLLWLIRTSRKVRRRAIRLSSRLQAQSADTICC